MSAPVCAVSTAPGRSAIAVIRASGAGVFQNLGGIFLTKAGKSAVDLPPRSTHYGFIYDGNEIVDDVLFLKFQGTASFTGEDSFEIHCHGNPLIIRRILDTLYRQGFQPAAAGEFTRRAYLNGKLDVDGAQAIAEIIEARNHEGLKAARRLKSGSFRSGLLTLRSQLMNLLADLNAELDFIDEDISFATLETKLNILADAVKTVENLAGEAERFETFKDGVNIAIVGRPNAGKSSLMNRLVGEERSIVSDIAGTTRDYIEAELTIAGFNVRLFDTAGLAQNSNDPIEKIGIERTRDLMARAHILLRLIDGSAPPVGDAPLPDAAAQTLTVINKADILHAERQGAGALLISAKTGAGIAELVSAMERYITERAPTNALPLNAWQREILRRIAGRLETASEALRAHELPEVITHTVQFAVQDIAALTGEITNEDILGRIFSRFCIGK